MQRKREDASSESLEASLASIEPSWDPLGSQEERNMTRNNKRNSRRWRLLGSLLGHSWAMMTAPWGLWDHVFPESAWKAFGEHVWEKEEEDDREKTRGGRRRPLGSLLGHP